MKIRTKSLLLTTFLLTAALTVLAYGVILAVSTIQRQDLEESGRVVENSVQRVALDALLQGDELQLVSYVNFLKAQYPALTYAQITWKDPPVSQTIHLGDSSNIAHLEKRSFNIDSSGHTPRKAELRLYIDQAVLHKTLKKSKLKLEKVTARVWFFSVLFGIALTWILMRAFTAPLKALSGVANKISAGQLGALSEWKSKDEIGDLVLAFNQMSERLKELDTMKRNFVSSVTHELRSPLGAMISLSSLIEDKLKTDFIPDAKTLLDYMERIRHNAQRLEGFVNQLLDAAKIEQGKFACDLKPSSIAEAAQDICRLFDSKAIEQKIELVNAIGKETPLVLADPERIRQVLSNLVSNAFKFTPEGGRVALLAERVLEGKSHCLAISIEDSGQGMGREDLANLFQAFAQGKNASQAVSGSKGTGLGLYIVKSIIDSHGGKIKLNSALGKGTQFTFTLKEASQKT